MSTPNFNSVIDSYRWVDANRERIPEMLLKEVVEEINKTLGDLPVGARTVKIALKKAGVKTKREIKKAKAVKVAKPDRDVEDCFRRMFEMADRIQTNTDLIKRNFETLEQNKNSVRRAESRVFELNKLVNELKLDVVGCIREVKATQDWVELTNSRIEKLENERVSV